MSNKLFGTDGIRGKAGEFPFTFEFVKNIASALAIVLKKQVKNPKVFIGKDTRFSSDEFEDAFIDGLIESGCDIFELGVISTPAVCYFTKAFKANAGVVISASHNPYYEAGIKIFGEGGEKLDDRLEEEIERLLEGEVKATSKEKAKVVSFVNFHKRYIDFLRQSVIEEDFSDFKIVVDTANGSAYKVADLLFSQLNCKFKVVNNNPNGYNINQNCGSLYPENLKAHLKDGFDIGFALDGDGDRVVIVDNQGNIKDGDDILYLLGIFLDKKKELKNKKVVATILSNMALEEEFEKRGIKLIRTKVGDRWVYEKMKQEDTILGGEQSGHVINLKYHITGDGLLTALQILKAIKFFNKDLNELTRDFKKYPQIFENQKVKVKKNPEDIPQLINFIKNQKKAKRIIIRPSGTEQVMRIMVEGEDYKELKELVEEIKEIIKKGCG